MTSDRLHFCRGTPENPDDWQVMKPPIKNDFTSYRHKDDPVLLTRGKTQRRRKKSSSPPKKAAATPAAETPVPDKDWEAEAAKYIANWADHPGMRKRIAEERLQVREQSLIDLGIGVRKDTEGGLETMWPSRDADARKTGILIRPRRGKKYQITGSRQHFYFADDWADRPGLVPGLAALVEGATGAAANLSASIRVVGRPGKSINDELAGQLVRMLSVLPIDCVIIVVGDNDERTDEKTGVKSWPGKEGAEKTAVQLRRLMPDRDIRIGYPPTTPVLYKDTRDFLTCDKMKGVSWDERGKNLAAHLIETATPVVDPDPPPFQLSGTAKPAAAQPSDGDKSSTALVAIGPVTPPAPPEGELGEPPPIPPTGGDKTTTKPSGGKPIVILDTDEYRVNDQVRAAIVKAENLYQRGGNLVIVANANKKTAATLKHGVARQPDAPVIHVLPQPILREEITRHATLMEWKKVEGELRCVDAHPTKWLVEAVHSSREWPGAKRLESLVCHPVVLADGTVVTKGTYHAETGLMVSIPADLEINVPDRPTEDDVRVAVDLLLDVVCDFPFESDGHRAAWMAALLTPFARFMFDGNVPWFLADGNVRGVGKGKMFHVISLILFGHRFATANYSNDSAELRKVVTTIACEGDSIILFDNLDGVVGNPVIDAVLTSTRWKDRILGTNKSYDGPLNVVWYGTGNNINVRADSVRRTLPIRIVSHLPRPEFRGGFKHVRLDDYVRANRPKLIAACLTIIRGWVVEGRPTKALPEWGSYEEWSAVVRQIIVFAGLPDPASVRPEVGVDAVEAGMAEIFHLWPMVCDDLSRGVTSAKIMARIESLERQFQPPPWVHDFREALQEIGVDADGGNLGHKLGHLRGRTFGDQFLDHAVKEDRGGVARWVVKRRGEADTPRKTKAEGAGVAGVRESSPAPAKTPKPNPYMDLENMTCESAGVAGVDPTKS